MPSAVRALISTWVASGTLMATIFEPCKIQSSPSGCAVVDTSCQSSPDVGSAAASATIAVPATIF